MEVEGSDILRGPLQAGQDPFDNRETGFPLPANTSPMAAPTVMHHNTVLPCSNSNLSANLNSDANSDFVVLNINPNAITEPKQSSSAFFNVGSPAAPTPTLPLTAKTSACHSSEIRIKTCGTSVQDVNDEDEPAAASLKLPMPMSQKKRGSGAGKKAQLHALGLGGQNFTLHVITVLIGQDVCTKIMNFSCQGPWSVCILSASGTVSNAAIRHSGVSGGSVTYEGHFEIVSLSGSFITTEDNVARRTGGLSISLAGPDGRVIGGVVVGLLMAASPVQVVLGTFSKESSSATGGEEATSGIKRAACAGDGIQFSITQANNHNLGGGTNGVVEHESVRYCVPLPLLQPLAWGGHPFSAGKEDDTNHADCIYEP